MSCSAEICWQLLYTKARAETWVEINFRRQGYARVDRGGAWAGENAGDTGRGGVQGEGGI